MAICIQHRNSGALFVLDRIEGRAALERSAGDGTAADKLVARLRGVFTKHQPVVAEVHANNQRERQRREEIQRQNQQYEDALRVDRERVRRVCMEVGILRNPCVVLFVLLACLILGDPR